jgi:hypothetical protein
MQDSYFNQMENPAFNLNSIIFYFIVHYFNDIYIIAMIFPIFLLAAVTMIAASPFPDGFDYLSNIDKSIIISARYYTPGNFVG